MKLMHLAALLSSQSKSGSAGSSKFSQLDCLKDRAVSLQRLSASKWLILALSNYPKIIKVIGQALKEILLTR